MLSCMSRADLMLQHTCHMHKLDAERLVCTEMPGCSGPVAQVAGCDAMRTYFPCCLLKWLHSCASHLRPNSKATKQTMRLLSDAIQFLPARHAPMSSIVYPHLRWLIRLAATLAGVYAIAPQPGKSCLGQDAHTIHLTKADMSERS